jgi:F-type H+-transporting ATPase subunit b
MTILAFASSSIQLVPDGTLLFHLVLVIVMVAVLNRTLLGPINRILEERERRIKSRLDEASEALAQAEERMNEYERQIRQARAGGYRMLEELRVTAAAETNQKRAAVKSEVSDWRERERANLQAAEKEAKLKLASDARALAAEISSRILGRRVG